VGVQLWEISAVGEEIICVGFELKARVLISANLPNRDPLGRIAEIGISASLAEIAINDVCTGRALGVTILPPPSTLIHTILGSVAGVFLWWW